MYLGPPGPLPMARRIAAVALVTAGALAALAVAAWDPPEPELARLDGLRSAFGDAGIRMTGHTLFTDVTRLEYCPNPGGEPARYCATTALVRSGSSIGNVNAGADASGRMITVGVVEPAGPAEAAEVFKIMIEELVCRCWEAESPGGFASILGWLEDAASRSAEHGGQIPLNSEISGLAGADILLEVGRGGDRWGLVITQP